MWVKAALASSFFFLNSAYSMNLRKCFQFFGRNATRISIATKDRLEFERNQLIALGYNVGVANRILELRPELVQRILSENAGRPVFVSREIQARPWEFVSRTASSGRPPTLIDVKVYGFGDPDASLSHAGVGGFAIELQIPEFFFHPRGFAQSYDDSRGHWGHVWAEEILDLDTFLTRALLVGFEKREFVSADIFKKIRETNGDLAPWLADLEQYREVLQVDLEQIHPGRRPTF